MGRKKRKVNEVTEPAVVEPPPVSLDLPIPRQKESILKKEEPETKPEDVSTKASSGYAMTTHSAEIIDEDLYVSDGSEDSADELNEIEMLLVGSRMGVMRRGIHHPILVQPNRQWVKKNEETEGTADEGDEEEAEQKRLREQEEELAKLDPAQRAARLLVEKQRKLEEAKENARRLESEENAGRDPCLFSKRTAFDIRFDQIDDKPWERGIGDFTDFFNYGLTEEDWLEYAQQQLMIRQELTDATKQRRAPDPTLVPVTPRAPSKQQPKVAVAVSGEKGDDTESPEGTDDSSATVLGPVLVKKEIKENTEGPNKKANKSRVDVHVGSGGAWGAGAAPGSVLAKMIEEQERKEAAASAHNTDTEMRDTRGQDTYGGRSRYDNRGGQDNRGWNQDSHNHRDSYGGQRYDQRHDRGGGYYGDRGGHGGRGGRGSHYNDHGDRGRDHRSHYNNGSDYQQRKRPRDDYDNKRYRR